MKETPVVVLHTTYGRNNNRVIATEQLDIGMQYVKVAVEDIDTQSIEHDSSSNIAIYFTEGTKKC